jgi:hypothetical protein
VDAVKKTDGQADFFAAGLQVDGVMDQFHRVSNLPANVGRET